MEEILDGTGSRKEGTKQYLVKWAGYGAEDNSWVSMQDMVHCSDRVQEYELRKVGVYSVTEACSDGKSGLAVFGVEAQGKAVTLAMDLNGDDSEEELLNQICKEAGVDRSDIVLAWASPPCETYSRANWSNLSRGFNYRKLEPGFPPVEGERGRKAVQHDRLTQRIKEVLRLIGCYVMEKPQGGMEKMLYMADWEDKKKIIDLCAFIWPFRKTTNLWVHGFKWDPQGTTGSGHYAIRTADLRAQENSLFRWKMRKKGYGFLSYHCRIPVRYCLTYVCSGLRELAMPAQKPRSHGAIFRHS